MSVTSQNAAIVAQTLFDKGWEKHQVAGMLGRLQVESGFNVDAVGDKNTSQWAYGIAQWRGDRLTNLKGYAADLGRDWKDIEVQALFLDHEMRTSEKRAGDMMFASASIEEAATAAMAFERPSGFTWNNPKGGLHFDRTLRHASESYQALDGMTTGFYSGLGAAALQAKLPQLSLDLYDNVDKNKAAGAVAAFSGQEGYNAYASQRALLSMLDSGTLPVSAEAKAGINREALDKELGRLPDEEAKKIEAMPDDERRAYLKDKKIARLGDEKTGYQYYDIDQAKFGEESQKVASALAESYENLPPEQQAALKETQQQEIAEAQQKYQDEVRQQAAAAQERLGNGDGMDPFLMIFMLAMAMSIEDPEQRAAAIQQIMSMMGPDGSFNPNRGAGMGGDSGPHGPGGPTGHGYGDLSGSTSLDIAPQYHTGGLDVKPEDIASDDLLKELSAKTGIPTDKLRERTKSAAGQINSLHPDIKAATLESVHQSWAGGTPILLDTGTTSPDQFGFRGNGSFNGVDKRIAHIIEATAREFPLRVRVMSGREGRGSGVHATGRAVDITLYDQDGNALGNYQNSQNFRAYELFAQAAWLKTKELYPDLVDGQGHDFNWGGLFGDNGNGGYKYGSNDTMDFRIEHNSKFRAGSIMGGLNNRHSFYDQGDILGGSKPFSQENFAEGMRQLHGLRLTPQQAAHNRATLFGVGRASGTLEARSDTYFHSRTLAFNTVPLDSNGDPVRTADSTTQQQINTIFTSNGLTANTGGKAGQAPGFHVGDPSSFANLPVQPGSRDTVPGGIAVLPATWRSPAMEQAVQQVEKRRADAAAAAAPQKKAGVTINQLPPDVIAALMKIGMDSNNDGVLDEEEAQNAKKTKDVSAVAEALKKSGVETTEEASGESKAADAPVSDKDGTELYNALTEAAAAGKKLEGAGTDDAKDVEETPEESNAPEKQASNDNGKKKEPAAAIA